MEGVDSSPRLPRASAWVVVQCNALTLDNPLCTAVFLGATAYIAGFLYLFIGGVAFWWTDKTQGVLSKMFWGVLMFTIYPYGMLLYYWIIWRTRAAHSPDQIGASVSGWLSCSECDSVQARGSGRFKRPVNLVVMSAAAIARSYLHVAR